MQQNKLFLALDGVPSRSQGGTRICIKGSLMGITLSLASPVQVLFPFTTFIYMYVEKCHKILKSNKI